MSGNGINSVELSLPRCARFIVLVPTAEVDNFAFGRCIWDIARPKQCHVLYLSVVSNLDDELRMIHKLTQLHAVTNDPLIHIDTLVKFNMSWVKAIRSIWERDDVILCLANQVIAYHVFWHKPISQVLRDQLKLPFYLLPPMNGHSHTQQRRYPV